MWWSPNVSYEQRAILSDSGNPLYNQTVGKVQDELLQNGTAYTIYSFCIEYKDKFKLNIEQFQERLINCKEPKYIYLFAAHIPGADRKKLEAAILTSIRADYPWDADWVVRFATKFQVTDIRRFEKIALDSKSAKAAYWMIKYVKGTNARKFKDIIIKSGRSRYIYELAKHLPLKEREKLQDMIIANKSNMYVRLFAEKVPGADKKKLERRIIRTRNAEQITKFGNRVPGAKCKRLVPLF